MNSEAHHIASGCTTLKALNKEWWNLELVKVVCLVCYSVKLNYRAELYSSGAVDQIIKVQFY